MSAVLSAEPVGDPESTRRVYATVVIFVALGVSMVTLAIWLFRRTAPEPQFLAPLEVMDTRRWRRSEPAQRGRELDAKRPPGARPLRRAAERPHVDSEFGTAQPVRSFDDLAHDAEEPVDPTEEPVDPTVELAEPTVELESQQHPPSGADDALIDDEFDFSFVDELIASGWKPGEPGGADAAAESPHAEMDETGEFDFGTDTGGVDPFDDVERRPDSFVNGPDDSGEDSERPPSTPGGGPLAPSRGPSS